MEELNTGAPIYVTAYPAAWRVEVVNDGLHRGFGYLRSSLDITLHPGTVC